MLGSAGEADDAVQEAWLRLSRSDTAQVENMRGWLTTVVSRICLDMLRARQSRREDLVDEWSPTPVVALFDEDEGDPEHEALIADGVGLALLVVLETLSPAERLAFVLHDMFGVPFEEIAPIIERNPAAARQLASRARRRVRSAGEPDAPSLARAAQGRRRVPGRVAQRRLRRAARGARSGRGVPGRRRHDRPAGPGRAHRFRAGGKAGSRARHAVRAARPVGDRPASRALASRP